MEQTKLNDEKWEQKDLRSARQSSIRGSAEIVAAMISVGAYKPQNPEDAIKLTIKFAEQFVDFIYKDMRKPLEKEKRVYVKLKSGKEKTIDHRDELAKLGFHWDKDKKAWLGDFDQEYWNKIRSKLEDRFTIDVSIK